MGKEVVYEIPESIVEAYQKLTEANLTDAEAVEALTQRAIEWAVIEAVVENNGGQILVQKSSDPEDLVTMSHS